jgi:hypothetical protein
VKIYEVVCDVLRKSNCVRTDDVLMPMYFEKYILSRSDCDFSHSVV